MKKFITILISLILCACCVGLSACQEKPENQEVHGVYKIYSLTANVTTYNLGDTLPGGGMFGPDDMELTQEVMSVDLDEDGMWTMRQLGMVVGGGNTWTKDGNTVCLVVTDDENNVIETTVIGEYMTIIQSDVTFVLKKV